MRNIKACGLAAFAVLSSCSVSVLADENTALQVGHEYMVTTNYPNNLHVICLLYTSPSPRDGLLSRMPSSA